MKQFKKLMKTTSVSMKSNWKSLSIGTVIVLLIFTNTDISVLETFLFAYNATPAWVTGIVFYFLQAVACCMQGKL